MKRGLVIGKFYPPHKGHSYLIESALQHADEVTVIVCERKDEKIPGALRAQWVKEMHPGVKVLLIEDLVNDSLAGASPEEVSRAWADYTLKILSYAPDVVCTSEEYGERWAKFLGSKHILIDMDRNKFPVSGTKVRENFLRYWDFLGGPVKSYFAKRICVLGAESTGTTTMAKALAEYYKTAWAPEFGRMYSEGKIYTADYGKWHSKEFEHIAKEQNNLEDELVKKCNKILICDTNAFATNLWHERYMGFMSAEVDKLSEGRRYDLYFLTDADIPFAQDGTRDGENIRHQMHRRFEEELQKRGYNYILLSGSHDERFKKAVEACDKILKL